MICIDIYSEALSEIWRFIFSAANNISNFYIITTLDFVNSNQKLFLMLTRKIPRDLVNVFLKVSDTCFSTPQCKICLLPINDTNAFCAVTHKHEAGFTYKYESFTRYVFYFITHSVNRSFHNQPVLKNGYLIKVIQ